DPGRRARLGRQVRLLGSARAPSSCTLWLVRRISCCLLLSQLLCAQAGAQTRDPTRAESLFWQGRAAFDAGNFSEACGKFAASEALDPARGTLFNWARCEEQLGQLASSRRHYQQVSALLEPSDARLAYARERLAEPPGQAPAPRTPEPAASARANAETVAFGVATVGIALGAIAGGVALYEKSRYDQECPGHECTSQAGLDSAALGSRWSTVST